MSLTGLVAILAIHGTIFAWLEGYACFVATASAGGCIHGTGLAVTTETSALASSIASLVSACLFAGSAARRAAAGCIGQSAASKKFLLAGGERKLLIAIAAIQCLVGQ